MPRLFYTYILTNKRKNVLYVGITGNLEGRVWQHKTKEAKGFTSKYNINQLVYYEEYNDIYQAIQREKQLKNWHRQWKLNLIKRDNPQLRDLARDWF